MKGVFVIGTDTGVGKSVVCAGLLKMAARNGSAVYWKPIQTGTIHGDDTQEVKALTGLDANHFMEPLYRFPEVLSPYMAAKKWGKKIEMAPIVSGIQKATDENRFVVIEGSGGLLVPYDESWNQLDLIKASQLPVLIVGKDKVGVINQALLTVEALKRETMALLGVVLTSSSGTDANSSVIEKFGNCSVIYSLLHKEDRKMLMADIERCDALKNIFKFNHPTV